MKKILILLIAAVTFLVAPAKAQDAQGNWLVGTAFDTAKSNTTKTQTVSVSDGSKGVTVQYYLHQITDTLTGYVSMWASLDGVTYVPYPSMDSVAISAAVDVKKIWLVNTKLNGNPIRKLQLRTRCTSNTTNTTSKAKLTSKMYLY